MPIDIPAGVKIEMDNGTIQVSAGTKVLSMNVHPDMNLEVRDNQILVTRPSDSKNHKALPA
jgi:large subunit ribosomal protein L6